MKTRRLLGLIRILVLASVAVGVHFLPLSPHHSDFTVSWGNFALVVPPFGVLMALLIERSRTPRLD